MADAVTWDVIVTDEAFYALAALSSNRLFEHVQHDLTLLETTPRLGRIYDPAYEAALPPFECRVMFCEHLGIYYRAHEEEQRVVVFAIEDQRRNPTERFEYHAIGLNSE